MVLPDSKQPDAAARCIVILLGESTVSAALADPDTSGVPAEISQVRTFTSTQDAVAQTDLVLQQLGKQSENVNQIIFGIEPSWVDAKGDVIAQHKPLMKKITDELELKPVGFVVNSEAAVQYCLAHDPLCSAVFVYLQTQHLALYVVKQGSIIGQTMVGRSGDTIADMTEGLARITRTHSQDAYLPAKILVLGASVVDEELEAQQQLILEHEWQGTFRFLQTPVVESIASNVLLERVTQQALQPAQAGNSNSAPAMSDSSTADADIQKYPDDAESFGFSESNNLTNAAQSTSEGGKTPAATEKMPDADAESSAHVSDETAEFAIDVDQKTEQLPTSFGVPIASEALPKTHAEKQRNLEHATETHSVAKKQHAAHGRPKHALGIVLGVLVGLVGVAVFGFFWLRSTAMIVLTVTPELKTVTRQATLTVDPNADGSSAEAGVLKGSLITAEVAGEDFIQTTGIKMVGDKAKGALIVCNSTTSPKTFPSGTKFLSGKLSYVSDADFSVASASTTVKFGTTTTECGKASVAITASDIGTEFNLGKETKFSVDGFATSSFEAMNEVAFSGGTSREVRVVSAQDRAKLLTALTQKLIADAEDTFTEQVSAGSFAVATGKHAQISAKFDHAVGEEADTITLNLALEVEGVSYTSADLRPLAEALLEKEVPAGYSLLDEDPQILSSPVESTASAKTVKLEAALTARAQANLDEVSLKQAVAGKQLNESAQLLVDREDVSKATVTLEPGLASMLFSELPTDLDVFVVRLQ